MSSAGMARAAVMVATNEPLVLREYPVPQVPVGSVLVDVSCCTICRSDLHTWRGRRHGPVPAILGHEIVGRVRALGQGRTHDRAGAPLAPGDRITWTLHSSCGTCYYCRDLHLPMKCQSLRKYGHDACDAPPHFLGGFAELCLVDAGTSVVKLPAELSDQLAAPANCAVATVVAGWDAAALRPQQRVLVLGAGGLGCYAAAYAAHLGCQVVMVADLDPQRLALAGQFGATHTLDLSQLDTAGVVEQVRRATDGHGVDIALEVAGAPAAVSLGLAAIRKGGVLVEQGCSYPGAAMELDLSRLLWNRQTLVGVHNYHAQHLCQAVDFLAATLRRFDYAQLVAAKFPLADINTALLAAERGDAVRVAVTTDTP